MAGDWHEQRVRRVFHLEARLCHMASAGLLHTLLPPLPNCHVICHLSCHAQSLALSTQLTHTSRASNGNSSSDSTPIFASRSVRPILRSTRIWREFCGLWEGFPGWGGLCHCTEGSFPFPLSSDTYCMLKQLFLFIFQDFSQQAPFRE